MRYVQKQSLDVIAKALGRTYNACQTKYYSGKPNDNDDFVVDVFIGICKLTTRIANRIKEFNGMKSSDYWKMHSNRAFLRALLATLPPGMSLDDFISGALQLCHINAHKLWNKKDPFHGFVSLHPSNFVLWLAETNTTMGELTHLPRVFVDQTVGFINDENGGHWEHALLQSYFPETAREQLETVSKKKIDDYNLYDHVRKGPCLEYHGGTTVNERNLWMHHWMVLHKDPRDSSGLEMVKLSNGNYALCFKQ